MKFSIVFISFVVILTSCKKNDFSGAGSEISKPLTDAAENPTNLDLIIKDINKNSIPDGYEDPTLVIEKVEDSGVPGSAAEASNSDLGKLFIPDGEGGFKEITGAYKKTEQGIIKLDELLKEESGKFFQVENPNLDSGADFIADEEGKDLPAGFEEAGTIFISTPDGLKELDTGLFEPTTPNADGSLTDPNELTTGTTTNIANIIIPTTGSGSIDGGTGTGTGSETGGSDTTKEKCDNHVAFVTSSWLTGSQVNPGGNPDLSGADQLCTNLAHSVKLCEGNSFKAILSSQSDNAHDRITINGPVFNNAATKQQVAANRDQFWKHKGWDALITFDESQKAVPNNHPTTSQRNNVWTNSNSEGFKMGLHCSHFSSNSGKGGAGSYYEKDDNMFDGSWWVRNCSEAKKIYCISQ